MSTQGDGMAEVTEADREKAREIFDCSDDMHDLRRRIADALAEEREKAFNDGALAGMKLAAEHREVTE